MAKAKDARVLSALCYILWPVALLVWILGTSNRTVKYNAINSTGLWVGILLLGLVVSVVSVIPVLGGILDLFFIIGVIIVIIMYAADAYNGKKVVIPLVTDFLKKNIRGFK